MHAFSLALRAKADSKASRGFVKCIQAHKIADTPALQGDLDTPYLWTEMCALMGMQI